MRQCQWLLANDVGLAVFGTNSEANSLSVDERMELLEQLVEAGVDPARMMPGTGCCALTDSVRLTAHAVKLGCAGVLMLPPFYYKGVSDEGLYRNFAEVIERVGDARLQIYLYHIPPVSQVPITLDADRAPAQGLSDEHRRRQGLLGRLEQYQGDAGRVRARRASTCSPAAKSFLLANMRDGGKGCISATANVNPAAIHQLYANWKTAGCRRAAGGAGRDPRRRSRSIR